MVKMREATPQVQQFIELALQLTQAAGEYAASGVEDEAASAMMRQLRVATAALNAALNAIQVVSRPVITPPPAQPVLAQPMPVAQPVPAQPPPH